ncbi:hypothetical protein L6452_22449 [Arctium lappa]|uniref:Uncharacterized protein n=1 Tax=Arctium lappa TaxID=4217 RepID=A0ACB9B138_ARCLA|nr:hypothetical protein L6452_22449 [Arctium lappa]
MARMIMYRTFIVAPGQCYGEPTNYVCMPELPWLKSCSVVWVWLVMNLWAIGTTACYVSNGHLEARCWRSILRTMTVGVPQCTSVRFGVSAGQALTLKKLDIVLVHFWGKHQANTGIYGSLGALADIVTVSALRNGFKVALDQTKLVVEFALVRYEKRGDNLNRNVIGFVCEVRSWKLELESWNGCLRKALRGIYAFGGQWLGIET